MRVSLELNLKRFVACLLVVLMFSPTMAVRADGLTSATLPDGLGIWEGGNTFHVMYNGAERSVTAEYDIKEYLVVSETYTDVDGAEVTVVYFNFSFISDTRWDAKIGIGPTSNADDDGNVYRSILLHAPNSYWESSYCTYSYYVTIKNGVLGDFILARRGSKNGLGPSFIDGALYDDTYYGRRAGRIYNDSLYQGKYTIYCSSPVFGYAANGTLTEIVCPATPLPGTAPVGGAGGYPCKTTFRMLTEGATVYNTYLFTIRVKNFRYFKYLTTCVSEYKIARILVYIKCFYSTFRVWRRICLLIDLMRL